MIRATEDLRVPHDTILTTRTSYLEFNGSVTASSMALR